MRMMMLAVSTVIFVMMVSLSASAEQSKRTERVEVTDRTPLTTKQADCVRRCLAGQTGPECRRARQGARRAWRRLLERLELYERRITDLEGRIGGLADRDRELGEELSQLTVRVTRLEVQITEISEMLTQIEDILRRLGELEEGQQRQDEQLEELQARIERLESQIEEVNRRNGVVQISPSGGFVGVYSLDGSSYTGGMAGMRVALRVTRLISVFVEPQVTLAANEYPAGTIIRGGLMFEIRPWVLMEVAASGMWVGFDAQLDAAAAYLTGDVGVMFRPLDWLEFGATVNTGAELDACDPAFAIGGQAWLRFNIPSL